MYDQPVTPPVSEGDTLEVNIEAVGTKGDGIAKIRGFVLFVPGVKEGDAVKIKITKVLEKVGFAEVIGKAEPRPQKQRDREMVFEKTPEEEPEEELEQIEDTEDFGEDLEEEK